jgi:hypothetical protein
VVAASGLGGQEERKKSTKIAYKKKQNITPRRIELWVLDSDLTNVDGQLRPPGSRFLQGIFTV